MGEGKFIYPAPAFWKVPEYEHAEKLFEIGAKKELFDGLEIAGETDLCGAYMGKFPLVSISLKGICAGDFQTAGTWPLK